MTGDVMSDASETAVSNAVTEEESAPSRPRKSRASRKKTLHEDPSDVPQDLPWLKPAPTETRSLTTVLRALARRQSRSLMLARVAHVVMEEFLGFEGRPPTKLLQLPNGARCTVEPDDALELHMDLLRMGLEERHRMQMIEAAAVQVDPNAVDIKPSLVPIGVPGPAGECVADNPRSKAASPTVASKAGIHGAVGTARPGPAVTADEFERAVGAAGATTK
jgi:hypothetical protein